MSIPERFSDERPMEELQDEAAAIDSTAHRLAIEDGRPYASKDDYAGASKAVDEIREGNPEIARTWMAEQAKIFWERQALGPERTELLSLALATARVNAMGRLETILRVLGHSHDQRSHEALQLEAEGQVISVVQEALEHVRHDPAVMKAFGGDHELLNDVTGLAATSHMAAEVRELVRLRLAQK